MNNPYTIKNLKTFVGMEGHGFNADLYRDGKKIAFVIDEGCGGCVMYQWIDIAAGHGTQYDPNSPEAKLLHAYAETLPEEVTDMKNKDGTPFTYKPDMDAVVNKLVDDLLTERDFKRMLKRITIRKQDDPPGEFRQFLASLKPTPENIAAVVAKNPNVIVLNALPFDQALAIYKGATP